MKSIIQIIAIAAAAGIVRPSARAATTINVVNRDAYGANVGWMDGRGDTTHGAVISEYVCSGYIYAANVGWIHLGDGSPANGIEYRNNSATDYGVNHDGLGNLRGYAWGANIGWISFESTGAPNVNLVTGRCSGYAYSANCGWISLSNAFAHVQTDYLQSGADTDGDGIVDAWELCYTNTLAAFNAMRDSDGDGQTDLQEAMADTNPLDPNDNLRILSFTRTGTYNTLYWTSRPTRFYRLEQRASFSPADPWVQKTTGYDSWLGWNNVGFNTPSPQYFYHIRAVKPLSP